MPSPEKAVHAAGRSSGLEEGDSSCSNARWSGRGIFAPRLAEEGLREMRYDFDFRGAKVLVNF